MASPSTETSERVVVAATELFRRQGFNGTSMSQIAETSGATTGSVYHFFPGGKQELAAEVLRTSGESYRQLVEAIVLGATDPAIAMTDAFAGAASMLASTGYVDPCPIGTIAREVASTHPELRDLADSIITSWVTTVCDVFTAAGIEERRAEPLARLAVASIEGGFIMARSARDVEAFITIGDALRLAVEAELARL